MPKQAQSAESSEERALYFLKSHGAQTAKTVAERLGMTVVGARQHLLKLVQDGLVETEERRASRGRPKQYWRLTSAGHSRFPDRHSDLTLELLRSTRAVFGPEGLERLIQHRENAALSMYQDRLASCGSLREKVAALTALRCEEGYMAEWQEEKSGSFTLSENHCPICAAAQECQSLCRSEIAIFRAALGSNFVVERLEHAVTGARRCRYLITEKVLPDNK